MIYDFNSYKDYLEIDISARRLTLKDLCEKTGIQPPYLTKVLKHDAHLTEEQVFSIARFFELSDEEEDYFLLLLRFAKANDRTYKSKLKNKILEARERKNKLLSNGEMLPQSNSDTMRLIEYFLSPNQQILFKALHIPKYRNSPYLLCQKLEILEEEIDNGLERLDKLGFIQRPGTRIQVLRHEPMLQAGHGLLAHHHRNWRIEAMKRYFPKHSENLKVTATLALDSKTMLQLKQKLQKLVEEMNQVASQDESPSQVVQLNLDLFAVC